MLPFRENAIFRYEHYRSVMGEPMQLSDRIGRRMKLHDLHVLMAVVQAGSMSKAAAVLNTGQSAISRSIAELEHTFGVRLLDRNRQGVQPTEYGRALLDGGTAVFDDLRQTVRNIEFLADPTVGEVVVGCNHVLASSFVSGVVVRLRRRFPRVVFRLTTEYVPSLLRELLARNVDLLVARRPDLIVDERLDYEFLFDDSYSIVAGAKSPWARRRRIELAELVDEPWVLPPPGSATGSVTAAAFRASGLDYPRAAVITDSIEGRKSLLATGSFISIFPDSIWRFCSGPPDFKILAVKQPLTLVPVGVITLKNRTTSPLAGLFISAARELAKHLTKGKSGGHKVG